VSPDYPKPRSVKVNFAHKDQISSFLHEFIEKMMDVAGDGHCGFHVFAGLHDILVDEY